MNNADFLAFHNSGFTDALNVMGSQFVYKGNSYAGVISSIELTRDLEEAGMVETLATQIVAALAAFPVLPVSGELVTIGTKLARIHRVSSDEVSVEMIVITATK